MQEDNTILNQKFKIIMKCIW